MEVIMTREQFLYRVFDYHWTKAVAKSNLILSDADKQNALKLFMLGAMAQIDYEDDWKIEHLLGYLDHLDGPKPADTNPSTPDVS